MAPPKSFKKWMVTSLSTDFRKAIELQTQEKPKLSSTSLLVRNRYVGINASDVNFTAGRYMPGVAPPFGVGFEAVGEVVDAGKESRHLVGSAVAHINGGAFAEYQVVESKSVFQIPEAKPEYLPLMVSALTAKMSLDTRGQLKAGETVLVTAAAGGTGQFAVQLAKLAGCHVIGTCSTEKKVEFLKSIGCDRAINISKEDLKTVLKAEYAKGLDVIYETIGGETFDICVDAMNVGARLIAIGFISSYKKEGMPSDSPTTESSVPLPVRLLRKSASVSGFFLTQFQPLWKENFDVLARLYKEGKLKSFVDQGKFRAEGELLKGISSVPDAVDYMYSRKSIGKVFVDLFPGANTKM